MLQRIKVPKLVNEFDLYKADLYALALTFVECLVTGFNLHYKACELNRKSKHMLLHENKELYEKAKKALDKLQDFPEIIKETILSILKYDVNDRISTFVFYCAIKKIHLAL